MMAGVEFQPHLLSRKNNRGPNLNEIHGHWLRYSRDEVPERMEMLFSHGSNRLDDGTIQSLELRRGMEQILRLAQMDCLVLQFSCRL